MMRALVDPNVFISFLLKPESATPPGQIFKAALFRRFTLLLPNSVVEEFSRAIATKPYLNERIDQNDFDAFLVNLLAVAERSEILHNKPAALVRDVKDDYLLAHAVLERADYIVSGDHDLQALRDVFPIRIVTPAEFAQLLAELPDEI